MKQNGYALGLVALVAAIGIGATICPIPSEYSACGIKNTDATVANDCIAVTGGYYADKEKKCGGSGNTVDCLPNTQSGKAQRTYYKKNEAGDACTSTKTSKTPNPEEVPYSCDEAKNSTTTCKEST